MAVRPSLICVPGPCFLPLIHQMPNSPVPTSSLRSASSFRFPYLQRISSTGRFRLSSYYIRSDFSSNGLHSHFTVLTWHPVVSYFWRQIIYSSSPLITTHSRLPPSHVVSAIRSILIECDLPCQFAALSDTFSWHSCLYVLCLPKSVAVSSSPVFLVGLFHWWINCRRRYFKTFVPYVCF